MPTWLEHSISWLDDHLLPCPFKMLTGCDCPACGIQRSGLHLLKGEIQSSFMAHPALIEGVLLLLLWFVINRYSPASVSRIKSVGLWVIAISTMFFYAMKLLTTTCCC